VIFPAHPRTVHHIEEWGLAVPPLVRLAPPMDYAEFIALEAEARLVITDSGGLQEETSALGVPCLTYRDSTERPVTIEMGTNRLVGVDPEALRKAAREALAAELPDEPPRIPLWDGQAGPRAAAAIATFVAEHRAIPAKSP
jgi:UDP-N-acetylglucosamine 2-epimerase (non-hydrolysing)